MLMIVCFNRYSFVFGMNDRDINRETETQINDEDGQTRDESMITAQEQKRIGREKEKQKKKERNNNGLKVIIEVCDTQLYTKRLTRFHHGKYIYKNVKR